MSRQLRFSIFIAAVVVVIGLVSWTVWLRPQAPAAPVSQEQSQALADDQYQQQVSTLLSGLATASDDSWKHQLESTIVALQALKVSGQIKYDHLLLFTALDVWKSDDLTTAKKTNVKTKLQTFASHQPWSKTMIETLMTKGSLAS